MLKIFILRYHCTYQLSNIEVIKRDQSSQHFIIYRVLYRLNKTYYLYFFVVLPHLFRITSSIWYNFHTFSLITSSFWYNFYTFSILPHPFGIIFTLFSYYLILFVLFSHFWSNEFTFLVLFPLF